MGIGSKEKDNIVCHWINSCLSQEYGFLTTWLIDFINQMLVRIPDQNLYLCAKFQLDLLSRLLDFIKSATNMIQSDRQVLTTLLIIL